MNPVIYVAGPFRANNPDGTTDQWRQEQNIRRAEELALDVWRRGGAALCPHMNTRFFQGSLPDSVWLEGDLALLAKCDAVLMTPDWEKSVGARAEHQFARLHGIQVLYTLSEVENFIDDWNHPSCRSTYKARTDVHYDSVPERGLSPDDRYMS